MMNVELNDAAKDYMQKYNWQHIVLNIEEITSWCAPPYMEMSVSFTEERENVMLERGYKAAKSELGNVYFPEEGITVKDQICVRYMDYPWLTCFEVDGIDIQK